MPTKTPPLPHTAHRTPTLHIFLNESQYHRVSERVFCCSVSPDSWVTKLPQVHILGTVPRSLKTPHWFREFEDQNFTRVLPKAKSESSPESRLTRVSVGSTTFLGSRAATSPASRNNFTFAQKLHEGAEEVGDRIPRTYF